jgi:hypothetical protein
MKCIATNRKMLKLAPDFALGYNNLANAYYMKDDFEKAVKFSDKAQELGFEVHPEFLALLEPHRNPQKKTKGRKTAQTRARKKKAP